MRVVIAIALALAACAPLAAQAGPRGRRRMMQPANTNPLGRGPAVVEEGRKLYNSSCTMCHGMEGTVGDRAPALAATRRYLRTSDDDLFAAIKSGIPGTLMPPSSLPENDVWKVVAYIRSLRATASDEPVQGDLRHGEEIFRGKGGCAKCHMVRGQGGLLGPDLSGIGSERTLRALRESLTTPRANIPRGYQRVRLTTTSGREIEGVVKNENNFSLQILDTGYNLHLLGRDEIRDIQYSAESFMPYDYDKRLSPEELRDLLAFLSRQVGR